MLWFIILLVIVLLAAGAWLFCIAPASPRGDFSRLAAYDYAHRGLHDKDAGVPENSLAAFRDAVKAGYGIEWDLQLTKDKKVVVHHDRSLKRLCGADVSIGDLTYSELQSYRLCGTGERIPLFTEALSVVSGKTPLIIELKGYDDPELLCPLVWEILKDYKGDYCIESFEPKIAAWFRRHHPHVLRGQLSMVFPAKIMAGKGGALAAFCMTYLLTNVQTRPHFAAHDLHTRSNPSLRATCGLLGMQEVSWTIRTAEEYSLCKNAGALCIFEHIRPVISDGREH